MLQCPDRDETFRYYFLTALNQFQGAEAVVINQAKACIP